MLILGRKSNQSVCFPDQGITVQVLQAKGSSVRLGIDAPAEVRILRAELADQAGNLLQRREQRQELAREKRHEFRNELHSLNLALHLFKQELEAGHQQDAETTFARLVECVERMGDQTVDAMPQESTPEARRLTALLVDDADNEREMLAGFLRLHGYQVATAADGLEAMEYLESNEQPSVALIDMRMPRCDGPTTIRRIRENPAFDDMKIFGVSGSAPKKLNWIPGNQKSTVGS